MFSPRARDAVPAARAEVLRDLAALLGGDQALYLCLGPEGALMSIKGRGTFAFGDAVGPAWHRMCAEERAEALLAWIHKAADYSRRPRQRWLPEGSL